MRRTRSLAPLVAGLLLIALIQGCSSKTSSVDAGEVSDLTAAESSVLTDADAAVTLDAAHLHEIGQGTDLIAAMDGSALHDTSKLLDASKDRSSKEDQSAKPDSWSKKDSSSKLDSGKKADAGGSTPPCTTGPGIAAYRFHYGPYGTSAALEAWGLRSNEWWEVVPVWTASALVDSGQSLSVPSGGYIRVRWSFKGVKSFTKGNLCIYARSYSTGASAKFRPWSPVHGETLSGPVSVYPYDWYCVDWTSFMSVNDPDGLLGYRLYADQYGSGNLAIHAVELCLEGVVYD